MAAAAALLPNVQPGDHGDTELPPGVDNVEFANQQQEQAHAAGQNVPPQQQQHVPPFWQPPLLPGQPPLPPFYAPQFYPPWWFAPPPQHVQHPVQPPPQPHKVKLPILWVNNLAGWFALAEFSFAQFNIVDSLSRFILVLPALDC